jgi:hypothetical protein
MAQFKTIAHCSSTISDSEVEDIAITKRTKEDIRINLIRNGERRVVRVN